VNGEFVFGGLQKTIPGVLAQDLADSLLAALPAGFSWLTIAHGQQPTHGLES
jgi:hypothetical protein